jgi:hypothetical protein
MYSGLIRETALLSAVIVALSLLKILASYKPPSESDPPYEKLRKKFFIWDHLFFAPVFIFSVLLAIVWYRLLSFFARLSYASLGSSVFLYTPSPIKWEAPSFFLGMITSAISFTLLFKLKIEAECKKHALYGNLRVNFVLQKLVRRMTMIIGPAALIFSLLAMNCYTRFSESEIVIKRFLSIGEIRYPYSRISAIKSVRYFKAPNGNVKERPHFAIEFDDGERWTTRDGLHNPDPETDRRLIQYVSGKCGKQPQEVDLE